LTTINHNISLWYFYVYGAQRINGFLDPSGCVLVLSSFESLQAVSASKMGKI